MSLVNKVLFNHYLPVKEYVVSMHDFSSEFFLFLLDSVCHVVSMDSFLDNWLEAHAYLHLSFLFLHLNLSSLLKIVTELIRSVDMVLSLMNVKHR